MDTSSIGGESGRFISTGAGCHRSFEHTISGGVMNLQKEQPSNIDFEQNPSESGSLRALPPQTLPLRLGDISCPVLEPHPRVNRSPSLPTSPSVST